MAALLARLRAAWLRMRLQPRVMRKLEHESLQRGRADFLRAKGDQLALQALAHPCPVQAEVLRSESTLALLAAEQLEGCVATAPRTGGITQHLLTFACVCALLPLLAACGGCDDTCDDGAAPPSTQPVPCHTHPEICQ